MAITLSQYSGALTVGATETSLVAGAVGSGTATGTGVLQIGIDTKNLVNGSFYELRIRRQLTSTSTKGVCFYDTFGNAATTEPIYVAPSIVVGHSWDVTVKNAGTATDVSIPYSLDLIG
jgi:hypothetical protein